MANTADYEYMSNLLKQWGLTECIEIFINEKVDAGCLRIIDDGDIRHLIPLAGDRARFKSNLALWKTELDGDISNISTPEVQSRALISKLSTIVKSLQKISLIKITSSKNIVLKKKVYDVSFTLKIGAFNDNYKLVQHLLDYSINSGQ